ncbi:unnamed protein product, partial [Prorocentrum cordatum]
GEAAPLGRPLRRAPPARAPPARASAAAAPEPAMEVRLSGTCGLSDDHVVSISAGTTRKLSTAGTLLKKPMRFPNLLRSDCKVLVIKVLRQEASVPLVLHPDGEEYCVDVPRSGGEAASLLLALRDSGAEEAATTAASDAASCAAGPAEASEYLAQRGVLPYVHRLLEALAVSRPQRPFEFMLEQLSMLCRVPVPASPGCAEAMAAAGESPKRQGNKLRVTLSGGSARSSSDGASRLACGSAQFRADSRQSSRRWSNGSLSLQAEVAAVTTARAHVEAALKELAGSLDRAQADIANAGEAIRGTKIAEALEATGDPTLGPGPAGGPPDATAEEEMGSDGCDLGPNADSLPDTWPSSLAIRLEASAMFESSVLDVGMAGRSSVINKSSMIALKRSGMSASNSDLVGRYGDPSASRRRIVIHPNSTGKMMYDILGASFLMVDVMAIPALVAWEITLSGAMLWFAWVTAVFWTFDIVVSLLTATQRHGELIFDLRVIRRDYMKSWFMPDFAIVLCDWLTLAVLKSTGWRYLTPQAAERAAMGGAAERQAAGRTGGAVGRVARAEAGRGSGGEAARRVGDAAHRGSAEVPHSVSGACQSRVLASRDQCPETCVGTLRADLGDAVCTDPLKCGTCFCFKGAVPEPQKGPSGAEATRALPKTRACAEPSRRERDHSARRGGLGWGRVVRRQDGFPYARLFKALVGPAARCRALARGAPRGGGRPADLAAASTPTSKAIEMNMSDTGKLLMRFMKMFVLTLLYGHFIACLWFFIGRPGSLGEEGGWTVAAQMTVDNVDFSERSLGYQYATSFHWAMSQITLGAMEVLCTNIVERLYTVVCLLSGLLFGSTLVSSLSAMMLEAQMDKRENHLKMQQMRRYLREQRVDRVIAAQVERQLADRLATRAKLTQGEVSGFIKISASLRAQLQFELFVPHLKSLPLFRLWISVDTAFVRTFCRVCMSFKYLPQQDDLFLSGNEATYAYYFYSGRMTYTQHPETSPVTETYSRRVHVESWLAEAALWTIWTHVGTAVADEYTEVAQLDVQQVADVLKRVCLLSAVAINQLTLDYCKSFHHHLQAAKPPTSSWPDDLQVPMTEWHDMVLAMNRESQTVIGLDALSQATQGRTSWIRPVRGLHELGTEVETGKSTVMLTAEGELQRVTSLVVFKIFNSHENLLIQIGKEESGRMKPSCQLLGGKQDRGELVIDTFERLLQSKLTKIANYVEVIKTERETETKESKEFGINTKYLRNIVHARLNDDIELDDIRHGIAAAVTAAAVTAAARVGAELIGGWAADGAGDDEDAELALRLRAIRSALARLIRGERASGAERATRNLGARAFLGEGAEVLEAALERPQANQRRGRSGALAPTDRGALSRPGPEAGWRPSLEARRRSMAPPTNECGYNGDAKNDDDGHQQHVDEQLHVQLQNQYEIKYGVGDDELEGYDSDRGPDEVRFGSKPEFGECAGDGAQDDDACTGEDGLGSGGVQAPLGTQHDEPSDVQDEGEYEECTDANLGAGVGAASSPAKPASVRRRQRRGRRPTREGPTASAAVPASARAPEATEAAEPAKCTAWRTAARRGRAATRGAAFVLADRARSAPEAVPPPLASGAQWWQWALEELGRDGGPKAPSACPPTTAAKGVECERDSADDGEAADDWPLGSDPSEYAVKHDWRMQPGVAQQDLREKVGIGSAGPAREVQFEVECTRADSQRVQGHESEAQDMAASEPALAETPMRVGTRAVSEPQSDVNQQRDSEQPEEQQQFPSERAGLVALRARYNGLMVCRARCRALVAPGRIEGRECLRRACELRGERGPMA